MRTVDDLVTWLRAIYDEREVAALAAGGRGPTGQWHTPDGEMWAGRVEDGAGNIVVYDEGSPTEAQAAHIADNDPAGTLAEVDAKRRILDEHDIEHPGTEYQYCRVCHDYSSHDAASAPCLTLRLLALPYADRPGYREEWRP